MKIPPDVDSHWATLKITDDYAAALKSARVVREWLESLEEFLSRPPRADDKDPKIYGHGDSNVKGVTSSEYDGVSMATLRHWLKWWSAPERSPHGREEAGRDPKVEVAKLKAEIDGREALRDS